MLLTLKSTGFSEKATRFLTCIQHRRVTQPAEKEAIYRLRYAAYLRRNLVTPREDGLLYDENYDDTKDSFTIMTLLDGKLASTIRIHVNSGPDAKSPTLDVFPDLVRPLLRSHFVIVDPTRLAASANLSKRHPELAYFALRPAWLAAEHFHADFMIVSASPDHEVFYKRVVGYETWSGLRSYPKVTAKVLCMGLNFQARRNEIEARYPTFRSTAAERDALFGVQNVWGPEQIARLTRLVEDGLSAGEIALALGCARNAAIEKADTLGLRIRGRKRRFPIARMKERAPGTAPAAANPRVAPSDDVAPNPMAARYDVPPLKDRVGVQDAVAALTAYQSRSPIGAVLGPDFHRPAA